MAQAIQTASLAEPHAPGSAELAQRVLAFASRRMLRPDGSFMFQLGRSRRVGTPHIRWTQAPMLLALAHLAAVETRR